MKYFASNLEIENILKEFGFKDFSNDEEKSKSKRLYKLSSKSRKAIFITNYDIKIFVGVNGYVLNSKLNENELRLILMFFLLPNNDLSEISKSAFDLNAVVNRFDLIQNELQRLEEFDFRKSRQVRLKRIIDFYQNIKF